MGSDSRTWPTIAWGEICHLKYGKSLKGYRNENGSVPVYGTNGQVGWCETPLSKTAGVVIGRKGAYRGIHYSDKPFYVIDTAFYLEPKIDFNIKWAYYSLLTQDINGLDSGSAIPSTRKEDFYALRTQLPPRAAQDEIVQILDSFERKIELNRQTNQTLESMAQALFKSWFVDFDPVIDNALAAGNEIPEPLAAKAAARRALREQGADKAKQLHTLPEHIRKLFPSRFQFTEELGWIPEGWQTGTLSSVTTELRRGISPKYVDEGGVRVINQRCIRDHIINVGPSRQHDAAQRKVDGRLLSVGDVLVNSTGVGTLGRIAQVYELNEATVVDSHVTVVRPSVDYFKPYVFGRLMFSIESAVEALGTGSTGQTELSRSDLGNLNVVIPPAAAQNATEGLLKYFADRIAFNLKQSETLELARDTLLPKLLSGELRIPETKKELDEALA